MLLVSTRLEKAGLTVRMCSNCAHSGRCLRAWRWNARNILVGKNVGRNFAKTHCHILNSLPENRVIRDPTLAQRIATHTSQVPAQLHSYRCSSANLLRSAADDPLRLTRKHCLRVRRRVTIDRLCDELPASILYSTVDTSQVFKVSRVSRVLHTSTARRRLGI